MEEVEVFKARVEDPRLLNLTINDLASLMMRATHLNERMVETQSPNQSKRDPELQYLAKALEQFVLLCLEQLSVVVKVKVYFKHLLKVDSKHQLSSEQSSRRWRRTRPRRR